MPDASKYIPRSLIRSREEYINSCGNKTKVRVDGEGLSQWSTSLAKHKVPIKNVAIEVAGINPPPTAAIKRARIHHRLHSTEFNADNRKRSVESDRPPNGSFHTAVVLN